MKTLTQKDPCTPVFTVALLTIANTLKKPKCPLTDEWIKNVQYIYTVKHYLAIKKNEIIPSAAMWMDLEIIRLSQVKSEKHKCRMTSLSRGTKKNTNELTYKIESERKQIYGYQRGWGAGINQELGTNRYTRIYIR